MSKIGAFNARFQQTMLRIKDPAVTVPFYEKNFGMKMIHKYDFPQYKFALYFMESQQKDKKSPTPSTLESESYLWSMQGATLELTHNYGSETDDKFSVWNGNTGGDASGELKADEPKFRGFGHVAFNTEDVYAACEELGKNGVKFQKKPDEGRMKGLAFALDPDGYWIEIVKRPTKVFEEKYNLSQTMLRVKDGPKSTDFYTKVLGMTLVSQRDFPDAKFGLSFLASITKEELQEAFRRLPEEEQKAHGDSLDPTKPSSITKVLWHPVLELTYNYGTENDPDFQVHDGNKQPQGFGHIGFLVDDLEATCDKMIEMGVDFKKKPSDGNMSSIAFAYDPDKYSVELVQRGCTFKGMAANL